MSCSVMRCARPTVATKQITPPEDIPFEVRLCQAHADDFDEGKGWFYEIQSNDDPGGARGPTTSAGAFRMGSDLPLRYESYRVGRGPYSDLSPTSLVTLELRAPDGALQQVEFELSDMAVAEALTLLRKLYPDVFRGRDD